MIFVLLAIVGVGAGVIAFVKRGDIAIPLSADRTRERLSSASVAVECELQRAAMRRLAGYTGATRFQYIADDDGNPWLANQVGTPLYPVERRGTDYLAVLLTGVGAAVGVYFGGVAGGTIGSALGGAVGKFLSGRTDSANDGPRLHTDLLYISVPCVERGEILAPSLSMVRLKARATAKWQAQIEQIRRDFMARETFETNRTMTDEERFLASDNPRAVAIRESGGVGGTV